MANLQCNIISQIKHVVPPVGSSPYSMYFNKRAMLIRKYKYYCGRTLVLFWYAIKFVKYLPLQNTPCLILHLFKTKTSTNFKSILEDCNQWKAVLQYDTYVTYIMQ